MGRDKEIGVATFYGFTQPPVQWIRGLFFRGKRAGLGTYQPSHRVLR